MLYVESCGRWGCAAIPHPVKGEKLELDPTGECSSSMWRMTQQVTQIFDVGYCVVKRC